MPMNPADIPVIEMDCTAVENQTANHIGNIVPISATTCIVAAIAVIESNSSKDEYGSDVVETLAGYVCKHCPI